MNLSEGAKVHIPNHNKPIVIGSYELGGNTN